MCLLNYNKKTKKYKHLTLAERTIRNAVYSGMIVDKIKKEK